MSWSEEARVALVIRQLRVDKQIFAFHVQLYLMCDLDVRVNFVVSNYSSDLNYSCFHLFMKENKRIIKNEI